MCSNAEDNEGQDKIVVKDLSSYAVNERWVTNRNVSEKHLKEIFGHFGEVKDVSIQYLPHSSISSGTAYIVMASEEDVEVNVARKNETSIMEVSVSLDGKDRDDPELDAPLKSQTKD